MSHFRYQIEITNTKNEPTAHAPDGWRKVEGLRGAWFPFHSDEGGIMWRRLICSSPLVDAYDISDIESRAVAILTTEGMAITQTAIASLIGEPRSHWSAHRRGTRKPSARKVEGWRAALDMAEEGIRQHSEDIPG